MNDRARFEEFLAKKPSGLAGSERLWEAWQAALSTRKPYGYAVLDKDRNPYHVFYGDMQTEADNLKNRLETNFSNLGPYRVVPLFYEDQS